MFGSSSAWIGRLFSPWTPHRVALERFCRMVIPDGPSQPVAFASQIMMSHEQNYSQLYIYEEALDIIFGLERFPLYLYACQFTIQADHNALQHILDPQSAVPTLAALINLSAFRFELQHIPDDRNKVSYALSRLPLPATSHRDVDAFYNVCSLKLKSMLGLAQDVKDVTRLDAMLSKVVTFVKSGWPEEMDDERIPWDLTGRRRLPVLGLHVVIPRPLRDAVLHELHVTHHDMMKMKEIGISHVWWETIDRHIETLVCQCASCQQTRPGPPTAAPLMPSRGCCQGSRGMSCISISRTKKSNISW